MSVSLSELANNLGWEFICNDRQSDLVLSVRQFPQPSCDIRQDILYIGVYEDVRSIALNRPASFVCADYAKVIDQSCEINSRHNMPGAYSVNAGASALSTILESVNILYPKEAMTVDQCEEAIMELLVILDRKNDGARKLQDALISGRGLQYVVDTAHRIFNNPIFVMDRSFKTIAYAGNLPGDNLWSAISQAGYYSESVVRVFSNDPALHRAVFYSHAPTILTDEYSPNPYISFRIELEGKAIGFACVIQHDSPFRTEDPELFRIFCKTLSIVMKVEETDMAARQNSYEYFITEILDRKISAKQIRERLNVANLKLKHNLFLLTVELSAQVNTKSFFLEYEQRNLEAIIPGGRCVIYNSSLVVLFSRDTDCPFSDNTQLSLCENLNSFSLIGGLSLPFSEISRLPEAYQQSFSANKLGKLMGGIGPLFAFNDYSLYQMFDILYQQKETISEFCNPLVLRIRTYDKKYKTSYLETLRVFLSCGRNQTMMAKLLGVHRNTVDYRVNRLKELFGVDINNFDLLFSFYLTFRILDFLERHGYSD